VTDRAGPAIDAARSYVGTTPTSGLAQLVLLLRQGLAPSSTILEIGCGTLHLAKALLVYLDTGTYAGVDPNAHLREAAVADDSVLDQLVRLSGAKFSTATDFYARDLGAGEYDFVFSHSVLSHASHEQLGQFMDSMSRRLDDGSFGMASVNLVDNFADETARDEWVYPGAVTFHEMTVRAAARAAGLRIIRDHEARDLYRSWCPIETHDWIVLRHE